MLEGVLTLEEDRLGLGVEGLGLAVGGGRDWIPLEEGGRRGSEGGAVLPLGGATLAGQKLEGEPVRPEGQSV